MINVFSENGENTIRKGIRQVPDTGTGVLDNTRPYLCSSIVNY